MGGNVFKNEHEVVRLNSEQLQDLYEWLENEISDFFIDFEMLKSYKSKQDHGDLDIIVTSLDADWKEFINSLEYNNVPYVQNSNVVSVLLDPLGFGKFQVDFIRVEVDEFESSLNYFNYNDLGNLIGRIAHSLGLKYGHDGLTYIEKDGDQLLFEINLSTNYSNILRFLGFPRSHEEFETLEEIFEYVASSKYFNPDVYLLHNRNHVSRVRDRKRKTYMEFLKWCDEKYPDTSGFWQKKEDKTETRQQALDFFDRREEYNNCMKRVEDARQFAMMFNGKIIAELSGFEGKELGALMTKLKRYMNTAVIREMLPLLSEDTRIAVYKDLIKSVNNS